MSVSRCRTAATRAPPSPLRTQTSFRHIQITTVQISSFLPTSGTRPRPIVLQTTRPARPARHRPWHTWYKLHAVSESLVRDQQHHFMSNFFPLLSPLFYASVGLHLFRFYAHVSLCWKYMYRFSGGRSQYSVAALVQTDSFIYIFMQRMKRGLQCLAAVCERE
jgi:hypothetical protein